MVLSASVVALASQVRSAPVEETGHGLGQSSQSESAHQDRSTHSEGSTSESSDQLSDSSSTDTTPLPEFVSEKDTSTFSCKGRATGYYADVKLACKVYHFCSQIEGIGETTYQRMSYMCLEGSIFDQKDLNCVKKGDLRVPCEKAEAEYESSNHQFDAKEESKPSMSDNLAANIMMNPLTRFIAGR